MKKAMFFGLILVVLGVFYAGSLGAKSSGTELSLLLIYGKQFHKEVSPGSLYYSTQIRHYIKDQRIIYTRTLMAKYPEQLPALLKVAISTGTLPVLLHKAGFSISNLVVRAERMHKHLSNWDENLEEIFWKAETGDQRARQEFIRIMQIEKEIRFGGQWRTWYQNQEAADLAFLWRRLKEAEEFDKREEAFASWTKMTAAIVSLEKSWWQQIADNL